VKKAGLAEDCLMTDALLTGAIGLLGVITGSVISGYWGWASERRQARADLYRYAFKSVSKWRTLGRIRTTKPEQGGDEINLLGEALEEYQARVPGLSSRRERELHLSVVQAMRSVFDEKDLTDENSLGELAQVVAGWERTVRSAFKY
jgi:hypothetical protein